MDTVGEKLHLLRKQSGYSQEELAYRVDVTRQTVSLWESNSLIPKADKLKMLCETFNVSSDYLLFDSAEPAIEQRQSPPIDAPDKTDEKLKNDNIQTKKKGKNKVIIAATLLALFLLCMIVLVCLMAINTPDGGYETVTAIRFDPDVLVWLIIIVSVIVVVPTILLVVSLIKARKK